ncbi:hypothetical protein RQP46_005677 [Phenoliferia psychrophenolica]
MKLTLATLALASIVAAAPLEKRAPGPSGTLVYPNDGSTYENPQGKGYIQLKYLQVTSDKVDYISGQTLGIDVTLEPMNNNFRPAIKLASRLSAINDQNQGPYNHPIEGAFSLHDACEDYRIVITEWQIIRDELISFRSAAPAITIKNCGASPVGRT